MNEELRLVIPAVAPPLNHAYAQRRGNGGRSGGRCKGDKLLAFERLVADYIAYNRLKWPFKAGQELHATIVFCRPDVRTKKDGSYNTKFGDVDGHIKHTIDAVFRCYKEETNDLRIGSLWVKKLQREKEETYILLQCEDGAYIDNAWSYPLSMAEVPNV
ncbi:Crossover junction endodeoxyribonuclease, RusA-like [uncultured Caudovirales phage]|uniref:Crossover junction endodeoxyribonuclease, RusA-like n=1 Tax=uncultured Caudovirales phage TaxID=2100421 RepID=A0A6J7X214_9CAUD|nr:Crossover junction endodeoxyribonuclease, RusA-like [uncultured Caudovirales phage]